MDAILRTYGTKKRRTFNIIYATHLNPDNYRDNGTILLWTNLNYAHSFYEKPFIFEKKQTRKVNKTSTKRSIVSTAFESLLSD